MTVLKRDTHYHTYSDYLTWDEVLAQISEPAC